jgi:hypothetical protein
MTLTADFDVELIEHHQHGAKNTAREKLADLKRIEIGPQKVKYPYYDYGPLLSRNAVFNMAIGGRGIGKTYGAKKLAIKAWIKNRDLFIYLRRYTEELIARDTFFADVQHDFPDWDFRANGNTFEGAPASTRDEKKRGWETMGYAVALSTAQKNKSISYHRVTLVIFDEFILEKGYVKYLPDEPTVLRNFYSTVDRGQDKTRVVMCANAVSMMCPHLLEYGIAPPDKGEKEIQTYARTPNNPNGFIAAHFPKSEEFAAVFYQTRFGEFIKGTEYARYAVGNEFLDNRTELVRPKNPGARHQFNLETKFGWISIWQDIRANEWYVGRALPANQLTFTMVPEKMGKDKMLLFYEDDIVKRMRTAYRTGRMVFDSPQAENVFLDLFNRK